MAPELVLEVWDHVTECGLEVRTGRILVMNCISRSGSFTDVIPGHYRVRVCHANLAESEFEASKLVWRSGRLVSGSNLVISITPAQSP